MIAPFRKINVNDNSLMQVQTNIDKSLSPISRLPLLNGMLVETSLDTTATKVEHRLDRTPIGWIVVGKDAEADIWQTADFTFSFITLTAAAPVNATLWVF